MEIAGQPESALDNMGTSNVKAKMLGFLLIKTKAQLKTTNWEEVAIYGITRDVSIHMRQWSGKEFIEII